MITILIIVLIWNGLIPVERTSTLKPKHPHSNLNKVSEEKIMRLASLFIAFLVTASSFSAAAAEPKSHSFDSLKSEILYGFPLFKRGN